MKTAIYARVSTEEQAKEGFSIQAQRERLTAYAQSQDWDIIGFYIDEGVSAKDTNRPELKRMMADIRKGKIDIVLVYKLDRLTRSVLDLYKLLEEFEKYNCKFKSATEVFETQTALGRMFITLVGALAQFEREQLAERVRVGMTQKAKAGGWNGGPVAFGYEYDGELKIVESEARIVRMMFEWYLSGKGYWNIANSLNQLGYLSKSGYEWTSFTVGYVLRNPIYIGTVRYNVGKEDEIETPDSCPAILEKELFEQVQRAIQARRSVHPRQATSDYIFSGFLCCNRCGSPLTGKKGSFHYYRCIKRGTCTLPFLEEGLLEESFLRYIERVIEETRKEYESATKEVAATSHEPKDDSETLKKEIRKLSQERSNMQRLTLKGLMTDEELQAFLEENRSLQEQLEQQLNDIENSVSVSGDDFITNLQEFRDNWIYLSNSEKKTALGFLLSEIKVDAPYDKVPRSRKNQIVEVKDIRFS